MKIETFIQIVKNTRTDLGKPCPDGMKWLLKNTKKHLTTDTFFASCKSINSTTFRWNISDPHSYLLYIFKYCLDWTGIVEKYNLGNLGYTHDIGDTGFSSFIKKHFNVDFSSEIPIPILCDALKRAFK